MTIPPRAQAKYRTLLFLVAVLIIATTATGVLISGLPVLTDQFDQPEPATEEFQIVGLTIEAVDNDTGREGVSDGRYELRIELQAATDDPSLDLNTLAVELDTGAQSRQFEHLGESVESNSVAAEQIDQNKRLRRGVYLLQPLSVSENDAMMSAPGDRYVLVIPVGVFINDRGAVYHTPKESEAPIRSPERGYGDEADLSVPVRTALEPDEGILNPVLQIESGARIQITVTTADGGERQIEIDRNELIR